MLEKIARFLGYTFVTQAVKAEIEDYISEGTAYLSRYHEGFDPEADPFHCSLLKNYCFYAKSKALDDFAKNYADDLFQLSNDGKCFHAG